MNRIQWYDASFVYFCQALDGGPIKIGLTENPPLRLAHIQACCPVPVRFVAIVLGDSSDEALLHRRFAEWRLHGEWFRPDAPGLAELIAKAQDDLRAINRRKRITPSAKKRLGPLLSVESAPAA
jgi:hypothetical protein